MRQSVGLRRDDVRCDLRVHLGEKVEPAVHVADRIDDHALRAARVREVDAGHRFA